MVVEDESQPSGAPDNEGEKEEGPPLLETDVVVEDESQPSGAPDSEDGLCTGSKYGELDDGIDALLDNQQSELKALTMEGVSPQQWSPTRFVKRPTSMMKTAQMLFQKNFTALLFISATAAPVVQLLCLCRMTWGKAVYMLRIWVQRATSLPRTYQGKPTLPRYKYTIERPMIPSNYNSYSKSPR